MVCFNVIFLHSCLSSVTNDNWTLSNVALAEDCLKIEIVLVIVLLAILLFIRKKSLLLKIGISFIFIFLNLFLNFIQLIIIQPIYNKYRLCLEPLVLGISMILAIEMVIFSFYVYKKIKSIQNK